MNEARSRVFRRRTFAIVVALTAVLVQAQTCERGDTYLLSLELFVDGQNLIQGFNINNRSGYSVTTESSVATLTVVAREGDSSTSYEWQVDGTSIDSGDLGVGGGSALVSVPNGVSQLLITVRAAEGNFDRYIVDVQGPLCVGEPDGTICALANGATGWCIQETCQISSLCPANKCADGNPCTSDFCDPADGTCSFVPSSNYRECGGQNGICFGDECVTEDSSCLRVGYGRINCCAGCGPYASTCTSLLPEGSECDPTGREAPDQTRTQAGHCSALGECLWDAGHPDGGLCLDPVVGQPCFTDTENAGPTDDLDCTARWCDPATGCQGGNLSGTFPCGGDGIGTCFGSDCKKTDLTCCLRLITDPVPQRVYTQCCPTNISDGTDPSGCRDAGGTCLPPGVCRVDWEEGNACNVDGGLVDPAGDGVCVITPRTADPTTFDPKCVASACAFEDPNSPGDWLEVDCDDGLECTEDACDPGTGQCTNTPLPDLTSCNGGAGVCLGDGVCVAVPEPCDVADATCYPCTLQGVTDAIAAGGGPYEFSCVGPQVVTITATLDVTSDVILDGGGLLTIEGNNSDLLFQVIAGVTAELRSMTLSRGIANGPSAIVNDGTLTLTDMTIADCDSSGNFGGPVDNDGSLTVVRSVFIDNRGQNGSAAITNAGTLDVLDSYFFNNTTSGSSGLISRGGALANTGDATLTNTTLYGNSAANGGGGIYNTGVLDLTSSTVSNNVTGSGRGGGIWNASPGALTLLDSEVDDNSAVDLGGGICNEGSVFQMTGGSVSGNEVTDPGVASGFGGGISTQSSDVTIDGVRIADNVAIGDDAQGGGISTSDPGSLTLVDSVLIGNNAIGTRADGGGVFSDGGASGFLMAETTVFGNYAGRWGGGLYLSGGGGTIEDSVITGNIADDDGGGFRSSGSLLGVLRTTVSGNRSGDNGGGIASLNLLVLSDSDVSDNEAADDGGGIDTRNSLLLERTTLSTNLAGFRGGGMHIGAGGNVSITDASTVSQNSAGGSGGGIRAFRSSLTVSDSTIDGNNAGSVGGGISSYGDTSGSTVVTIERSAISSNVAFSSGGGVESQWTRNTLTIAESAIVGNDSDVGDGGGVYVYDGATASITNTTIAENFAFAGGDGLQVDDNNTDVDLTHVTFRANGQSGSGEAIERNGGDVNLQNTLFVQNGCDPGPGGLTSLGGNIQAGGDTCDLSTALGDGFVGPSTLNLSPLGDNGGPTVSYLPGPGSTAIDFSPCIVDVTTEQRGINSRPQGTACDCGAVEAP